MTTLDLTKNKERIIKKIKFQITLATKDNIIGVMNKMIVMLPQFEKEKATMANIDKLTMKAILSYIKYDLEFTQKQDEMVMANIERKRTESLPSNLQK